MTMHERIRLARSYRRFKQDPISADTLRELVDLARLSPSGGNQQPLKYILSATPDRNAAIFPFITWAAYLPHWPGPCEGERPAAYIVMLLDSQIAGSAGCDHGIAAHSIVLGASEKGIGACIIGSLRRKELTEALGIPDLYQVLLIIALGVPGETVILEDVKSDGSVKYYRDADDIHHVPKRTLDEIIVSLD
jgi:nitroreductase